MAVKKLDKKNFKKQTSEGVTLAYFWADWCPPCKFQGPVVENLAESIGDKATIGKIDVDANQEVANQFNIRGIPTLILFKDGEVADTMVGLQSEEVLKQKISQYI